VDRDFVAQAPNRCRVADFTHVAAFATFAGVVYVVYVVDTFSRRVVGWSAATSKETRLVLDALEMALLQRNRYQHPHRKGKLKHHSDAGAQYTSFAPAEHLDRARIAASVGRFPAVHSAAMTNVPAHRGHSARPKRQVRPLASQSWSSRTAVSYIHRPGPARSSGDAACGSRLSESAACQSRIA
jgi:putative transposase